MPLPLALFAYARPHHLARTLASLRACHGAETVALTIFCDGVRGSADAAAVAAVHALAHATAAEGGFASVAVVKRERNIGLARSITSGVSDLLRLHDRVVVVEDDLELSPFFLDFMSAGLALYADDASVASIHGYLYPVDADLPATFFVPGADCWGWATWRRAWSHWREDGSALLGELQQRGLVDAFDLGGAARFSRLLREQAAGRNDSWAVRWHAATFLAGMQTLFPGHSLVRNLGCDATGTHPVASQVFTSRLAERPIPVERVAIAPCPAALAAFARFHHRLNSPWHRVRRRLARAFGRADTGRQRG